MYFHTNKSSKKKIITSLIVLIIFSLGLIIFFLNIDILKNYKTYNFQSHFYVAEYKLKNIFDKSKPTYVSGAFPEENPRAESIPILVYHGVLGDTVSNYGHDGEAPNIDLATFWDQMKTLKEDGWQTITIDDLYNFKLGLIELPPKSFMITFDDGRKDSYYPTNPILKTLGFHAVMFVIDRYSLEENSSYYLTKNELLKMSEGGNWEVQSHGYSSHSEYPIDDLGNKGNFFSNKLWLTEFERIETKNEFIVRITEDFSKSKEGLENAFNKPITAFAFPFGDYGQNTINFPTIENTVVDEVLNLYQLAFYQYSSLYRFSQTYPEPENLRGKFMIKRIDISRNWSGNDLINMLKKGKSKTLPFSAKLDETDGWINTTWGTVKIGGNKINMESLKNSTGSTMILDGTNLWTDYIITANIKWIKGSNFYLEARVKDDDNFSACNFGKKLVHVEQIFEGQSRVIAGVENEFDPKDETFTAGMKVNGRTVECSINGKVIVSSPFLEEPLNHGGIGVKIWDSIPGNSQIIIESLSVENIM